MVSAKKSLAKFVTVWIISSVVVIAFITLAASLYISNQYSRNSAQMTEQLQQLVVVQSLNTTLNRLVSDYRGYLAFGRQEFLDVIKEEKLSFAEELSEYSRKHLPDEQIKSHLQNNTSSIKAIDQLWTQYAGLIERAIVLKQQNEQQLADRLSKDQTTPVINEIFNQFNIITERQNDNVALIMQENRMFNRLLYILLFGFSTGLALLGFFLVLFMKRSVIIPINKLEHHVKLISTGDYVEIPNSGRSDEIGQLGTGINEMSRLLKLRLEAIEVSRAEVIEQRDELEAQNEEIVAQNEEILAQQEEQDHTLHILKQREYLIRQIIETINEGMIMCDQTGIIMLANGRIRNMLELDIREGMQIYELLAQVSTRPDYANLLSIINDVRASLFIQDTVNSFRFKYTSSTNQTLHFDLYSQVISRLKDDQDGYLFVFRDRTEEEKVDEMKNEFVSVVSHELRTPLSSILGFIEILLHREIAPDKQKKYLEIVFKESTRLSNLIIDFLDIQRMEAGKQLYHFRPLALNELIQELVDRYNDSSTHQIHVQGIDDPSQFVISGDYDRLTQAFDNLLSNAVKYSPHNNRIDLKLKRESNSIRVDIKDYGLGIPDSSRGQLFTKFYRVDNTDRRKIGGTGLGLVIVKEIIEAHNGSLTYESVLGEGSTFTAILKTMERY
jgi:signal transduction histidine kinase